MIRKLKSGDYRIYSRSKNPKTGKRRNLGTFKSLAAAKKHERAIHLAQHFSNEVTKAIEAPLQSRCNPEALP